MDRVRPLDLLVADNGKNISEGGISINGEVLFEM